MATVELTRRRDAKAIRLNWANQNGDILVTPSDSDRFCVKVGKAIEILRQHDRESQFGRQFTLLVKRLAEWLDANAKWSRAFLTAGEGRLRFVVMRSEVLHDDETTDALSDLELEIANDQDLALIKVNTTALPLVCEDALQSFLDSDFCMEYNGDGARPYIPCKSES